ncbi:MAG: hypothetical protein AAFX99_20650 [Myxococcota bacterium]
MSALLMVAAMAVYTGVQVGFHELSRHRVILVAILFVVGIGLLPWVSDNLADDWFRWLKTLSVLIPILLLNSARIAQRYPRRSTEFLTKKWVMWVAYAVIMLNIFEAVVKDGLHGSLANALVGVALMVTLPIRPKRWRIEREAPNDFVFAIPTWWIVLYTAWNICFVYTILPQYTAHIACILMVPLFYAVVLKRPDLWYSARAYTLGLSLLIRASSDPVTQLMDTSSWANGSVAQGFGIANLVLAVGLIVRARWVSQSPSVPASPAS